MESATKPSIPPENSKSNARKPAQSLCLPQELITNEILLCLPAKSIGRFRIVSKTWHSLLSNPHFIKSHLTLHSASPCPKLIYSCNSSSFLHILSLTPPASSNRRNDAFTKMLRKCESTWDSVFGSCHGLVLVGHDGGGKFLINPTTQEIVEVPEFSFALHPSVGYSVDGFGYDSSSEDYKIVTLSHHRKTHPMGTLVDVYSLKLKAWRRVGNFPYGFASDSYRGILLNGALHWLVTDTRVESSPTIVVAFNLSRERFERVPTPSSFEVLDYSSYNILVVLGGCLGVVSSAFRGNYRYTDVWVLKEYGKLESWTKFSVTIPQNTFSLVPICQFGNEEVVFLKGNRELVLHNLTNQTSRNLVVDGRLVAIFDGILDFSETLVSPSFSGWDVEA